MIRHWIIRIFVFKLTRLRRLWPLYDMISCVDIFNHKNNDGSNEQCLTDQLSN